jgi:hypothetical protein
VHSPPVSTSYEMMQPPGNSPGGFQFYEWVSKSAAARARDRVVVIFMAGEPLWSTTPDRYGGHQRGDLGCSPPLQSYWSRGLTLSSGRRRGCGSRRPGGCGCWSKGHDRALRIRRPGQPCANAVYRARADRPNWPRRSCRNRRRDAREHVITGVIVLRFWWLCSLYVN